MRAFKTSLLCVVALSASVLGSNARAENKELLQGSDTMAGVMNDAIIAAGMDANIGYVGGGSGTGEAAIVNGTQGIASMSRSFKSDALATLKTQGASLVEHVVGLDGVSLFVNNANTTPGLSIATIRDIYTCKITNWSQIPGSTSAGAIHAFRRDDKSGTTDTIKNLASIPAFGACVQVVAETADIAEKTSSDVSAVGYAGLSAKRDGNLVLPIAVSGTDYVIPTAATIRAFTYPLARKLFVYEVSGSRKPNATEASLLEKLTDRSFLDPIIQSNEFFTID